ncbi:hypothetical protein ES288_D10G123500v1 [Gossypium darwinii]|uniref:DUF659 domain-containing protein n=1 Tax=Gossypium darwinii TaxID=34276 RepID=A0A5D2B2K6_GOSDA|nr:hypothetical protein ES288_D10G123500v1 [Gossypium darwinii]
MTSRSGSGSVDSSDNVTNASVSQDDISNTHFWIYVTKLPKTVERVTLQHLAEMQKIVEDVKLKSQQKIVSLLPNSKRRKGPLEQSFNLAVRENLDSEIARMFYSGGLPFHLTRNPHYVNAFTLASKNLIPETSNIERLLQPIKGMWREKGISLICDGWTDAQRQPLINFMVVSEGGVVFLKAVNYEKEYKDKFYVTTLIKDAISEVGAQNVVQVITDNAPICKDVGSLVETQHPHIFWTPCVVHTLNLALKNICAAKNIEKNEVTYDVLCWINNVGDDAIFIRNFIMNHSMRLAIFNSFVPLKLLTVVDTLFSSTIVMLKRFKLIKRGLQNMVIGDEWSTYREDDISKAYLVKEKILDDLWCDKVDYILTFTEPINDMLRIMDTDKPTLHLVYEMWDEMIEKVNTSIYKHEGKKGDKRSTFYEVVYDILIDRWTKSSTPLHCMAHSLNPSDWLNEVPNHLPPLKDVEISEERNKCLRRYFPSTEERNMRNWSTYSFIHSMRRNKINPQCTEDLVFVHTNLRLLSRKTLHYKGENKMWDIRGDVFDSFEGVGILGVASLSLDEPDMEMVIFANEEEDMENANAMN